jgi:hypothetical protein
MSETRSDRAERILAYVAGELSEAERDAFEERLFAGSEDGAELGELSALAVDLREAAFIGILTLTVTPVDVERLRAAGYRMKSIHMRPGEFTEADASGDFDLLLIEWEVDLAGVEQLDVETCGADGRVYKRMREVPFDPEQRAIVGYCARELALRTARVLPEGNLVRFVSVEDGHDRVLGEYRGRFVNLPEP